MSETIKKKGIKKKPLYSIKKIDFLGQYLLF